MAIVHQEMMVVRGDNSMTSQWVTKKSLAGLSNWAVSPRLFIGERRRADAALAKR
jgi:hypothetical protein